MDETCIGIRCSLQPPRMKDAMEGYPRLQKKDRTKAHGARAP